ncbi:acyl-CoA dehydrogenase family protein [Kutzneria buriramensis]|uniref:Alkylation response protein AidB-like acyl-CoA dehydrogenase n=1 Tax=Kutzneria buriramensis TaxID=1045776 RepID=A0A3E0GZT6_9PSEU|nr:acyl-CoA dehydrogenase family protein [Kutzneria buriramensis]REH35687.1 alkylation response protein AidB-like acyl-CoA dehydrogenase [Kutzneria buriramensis]
MEEELASAYDAARAVLPVLEDQAADTDRSAEFPVKAVDALRAAGLMGLLVPVEHGGSGGDLGDLVAIAGLFGSRCVSTALIWAMHCQQVDCVVRFGGERLRAGLLPRIAAGEVYLASVTTEAGKGGHLLSGDAALVGDGDQLRIDRQAPIVTGGGHAEGFLVTMRESPDADDHRVTLCYAERDQLTLETTGEWDPLGMRGTASAGMRLRGAVPPHQVVGEPGGFRAVAVESMIPAGHLGWSAVWLGAARRVLSDVLGMVRARGAEKVSDLTADRLARARIDVELVASYLASVRDEVLAHRRAGTSLAGMPTQIHLNNLKVAASELTFRAVDGLMQVAGLAKGYLRDSPIPVERVFRDLRSAALNYGNDRLTTMTGALALLDRDVTFAPAGLL